MRGRFQDSVRCVGDVLAHRQLGRFGIAVQDGRSYPWGNDESTSQRANFGKSSESPYKGGLAPAGSREAGKSPYGVWGALGTINGGESATF